MYDVVALGELLIDFTQKKTDGTMEFVANPGGAPGNVLACLSKLGKKTAFIGKVGNDIFGNFLIKTLVDAGIDTGNLIVSDSTFTTLAFVSIDDNGNRSFSFSRNKSADIMLEKKEIDFDMIRNAKIFHCGTLSLTDEPAREATLAALDFAERNGVMISVDPNLRENLWPNSEEAKKAFKTVLSYGDIIKISDYEVEFLYGKIGLEEAAEQIKKDFGYKVLFITCGGEGAFMSVNGRYFRVPCYEKIKPVDTTGAGDAFFGGAIYGLLGVGLKPEELSDEEALKILNFANAAANLSTTKFGAIPAMPTLEEIEKLLDLRYK